MYFTQFFCGGTDLIDYNITQRLIESRVLTVWRLSIELWVLISKGLCTFSYFLKSAWYFISARLLENPSGRHQLQDDLESFFYVVLFITLCLFDFRPPLTGKSMIEDVYDFVGGKGKRSLITRRRSLEHFSLADNNSLNTWIQDTLFRFHDYYNS
jgi:hypothetical protein